MREITNDVEAARDLLTRVNAAHQTLTLDQVSYRESEVQSRFHAIAMMLCMCQNDIKEMLDTWMRDRDQDCPDMPPEVGSR